MDITVEKLISSFSDAFNVSAISRVVALYAQDGVLMPNNAPLAKGHEQIQATYEFLFKTFKINIGYVIDEIVVSGDYAFARTHSKVNTLILANNETVVLENKELFVLQKESGGWKIAQYIFNSDHKN